MRHGQVEGPAHATLQSRGKLMPFNRISRNVLCVENKVYYRKKVARGENEGANRTGMWNARSTFKEDVPLRSLWKG